MSRFDFDPNVLDWEKVDGLIPVVVQDVSTLQVLMLGYMNAEALEETLNSAEVTFFSRTKSRLWKKGETSGNVLRLKEIRHDCDNDTLLVYADPVGPTCHLGEVSCFSREDAPGLGWLARLEQIIAGRADGDPAKSYTAKLLQGDVARIAQKVGEEGVESALAAVAEPEKLNDEAADLLFHLCVLLHAKGSSLEDVVEVLRRRHAPQDA